MMLQAPNTNLIMDTSPMVDCMVSTGNLGADETRPSGDDYPPVLRGMYLLRKSTGFLEVVR